MNLVVQHLCKSTGDTRIYTLNDAFVDGEKLVGDCFGQIEKVALDTIISAADIATGDSVEIAGLIADGLLQAVE